MVEKSTVMPLPAAPVRVGCGQVVEEVPVAPDSAGASTPLKAACSADCAGSGAHGA